MILRGLSDTIAIAPKGSYVSVSYSSNTSQAPAFIRAEENGRLLFNLSTNTFGFFKLPTSLSGRNYSITSVESKQGDLYDITVTGMLSNVNSAALAEFRRMKKMDFALKIFDGSNQNWLFFDYDFPATFNFSVESGDVGSNRSRIKFTFKGRTPYVPLSI